MGMREFMVSTWWPLFALIVFIVLAKPLRGMIGRIRKLAVHGWSLEADPEKAKEIATKALASTMRVATDMDDHGVRAQASSETRKREIESVAAQAAIWGQIMAFTLPPPEPGQVWVPRVRWNKDRSITLGHGEVTQFAPNARGEWVWVGYEGGDIEAVQNRQEPSPD